MPARTEIGSDIAVERVLFLSPRVHLYMIPPMASGRGHVAASWTRPPSREIYANEAIQLPPRLRIVEKSTSGSGINGGLSVTLLLEDPHTAELFAAAPYAAPATVMQAIDSSRFFALTVVDQGRKAVLGMAFEERSEAFDFNVALQAARRTLGWETAGAPGGVPPQQQQQQQNYGSKKSSPLNNASTNVQSNVKRDYSLKKGEVVRVELPASRVKRTPLVTTVETGNMENVKPLTFNIAPPPPSATATTSPFGGFATGLIPPPPSAAQVKEEQQRARPVEVVRDDDERAELASLGFDDGEFGEFQ